MHEYTHAHTQTQTQTKTQTQTQTQIYTVGEGVTESVRMLARMSV